MDRAKLEEVWKAHIDAEFEQHDVEATLQTMTEDAFVENVPTQQGGRGKNAVREFYTKSFVHGMPDDMTGQLRHRVIGESALVEELHHTFTHTKQMDWILPGIPPTNKKVAVDIVAIVYFRGDKICGERIYWDHATVVRQVGLLPQAAVSESTHP